MKTVKDLTKQDYQFLVEFAKSLNPMEKEFRKKALESLLTYFPFEGAAFPLVDNKGYYKQLVYANFSQASIEAYENLCYKKDFFAPANATAFQDNKDDKIVLTIEDFKTFVEYEASSLYTECLNHNNFYYEALVLLRNEQSEPIGAVAVYHDKTHNGFSPRERDLLCEISKILEKACLAHLTYYKNSITHNLLQNIMFQHPMGMILCDSNFNILNINKETSLLLEKTGMEPSLNGAKKLLQGYILPTFLSNGAKQYCLLTKPQLEITIDSMITKDAFHDTYNTHYVIYVKNQHGAKEADWNAFLQEKGLTERECEIAELLRLGSQKEDIAERLHISINTVKRHTESIYRKLNISRMNQLQGLYVNCNTSEINPTHSH
jgi:DNA-binding CsgD family transcriptional regulator